MQKTITYHDVDELHVVYCYYCCIIVYSVHMWDSP